MASSSKSSNHSLNKGASSRSGSKETNIPKTIGNVTSGGKGDKDGKGDIQAKKAGTSAGKRVASK